MVLIPGSLSLLLQFFMVATTLLKSRKRTEGDGKDENRNSQTRELKRDDSLAGMIGSLAADHQGVQSPDLPGQHLVSGEIQHSERDM